MTEQSKENRGAIWKNTKKERDTHPDFTGELDVGGRKYWVSAWKRREDASPKAPALSFSIKPKEDQPQREAPISQRAMPKGPAKQNILPDRDDMDGDNIPF